MQSRGIQPGLAVLLVGEMRLRTFMCAPKQKACEGLVSIPFIAGKPATIHHQTDMLAQSKSVEIPTAYSRDSRAKLPAS